jgi:hypothetical protein
MHCRRPFCEVLVCDVAETVHAFGLSLVRARVFIRRLSEIRLGHQIF